MLTITLANENYVFKLSLLCLFFHCLSTTLVKEGSLKANYEVGFIVS